VTNPSFFDSVSFVNSWSSGDEFGVTIQSLAQSGVVMPNGIFADHFLVRVSYRVLIDPAPFFSQGVRVNFSPSSNNFSVQSSSSIDLAVNNVSMFQTFRQVRAEIHYGGQIFDSTSFLNIHSGQHDLMFESVYRIPLGSTLVVYDSIEFQVSINFWRLTDSSPEIIPSFLIRGVGLVNFLQHIGLPADFVIPPNQDDVINAINPPGVTIPTAPPDSVPDIDLEIPEFDRDLSVFRDVDLRSFWDALRRTVFGQILFATLAVSFTLGVATIVLRRRSMR